MGAALELSLGGGGGEFHGSELGMQRVGLPNEDTVMWCGGQIQRTVNRGI